MGKRKKDPLLEALNEGRDFTWTVPDGGNLASMRKAIKHGQTLTMSPVTNTTEIQVRDLVLVKWYQSDIFHIVGEIQGGKFLIANSLGKENGWVKKDAILGKITKIIDPEPRPSVPSLLEQLKDTYINIIEQAQPASEDEQRLLQIADNLRWYADRIGEQKWDVMPRDNLWSFHQNLWRLTKQAKTFAKQTKHSLHTLFDQGYQCIGQASEIISLFQEKELESK